MRNFSWTKRLIAVICASTLSLCFVACGKTETPGETTSAKAESLAESIAETETQTVVDSSQTEASVPQNDPDSTSAAPAAPKSQGEILALYAKALQQSNLKRSSAVRTLKDGTLEVLKQSIDLTQPDYRPVFETTDDAPSWPALAVPDTGAVASAEFRMEGGIRILTFHLNAQTGAELIQGVGGYLGFVDGTAGTSMINAATAKLNVTVDVKSLNFTLNEGVLIVTLDGTKDVIKKVNFSCAEGVAAQIEWKHIPIPATIHYTISTEYTG